VGGPFGETNHVIELLVFMSFMEVRDVITVETNVSTVK
jgi:hypothetical protein